MLREMTANDVAMVAAICGAAMPYDTFTRNLVKSKTVDAKDYDPELTLVDQEGDLLRGFIAGLQGERKGTPHGWVRLMGVHPRYQSRGIGTKLLKELEQRLLARGVRRISIMDATPNYFMPGVDVRYTQGFCFFAKHGYQRRASSLNMICDLDAKKLDADLKDDLDDMEHEGITIRRCEDSDYDPTTEFLERVFPPWVGEVLETFENKPISTYIALSEDKVIGFSSFDSNNKGTGWFGPMGVDPERQTKGVGTALLRLCLRDLAEQGRDRAIIPWVGPVRFYAKRCAARIDRVFWIWEKQFE